MHNITPLRYPGGKTIMTPLFIDILSINNMSGCTYAEPYAGGAGAAINLLLENHVNRIMINDANIAIYSFWKFLKEDNERFVDDVLTCTVDLNTWRKMKNIFLSSKYPSYELAFATFFLSRTNRSGILNAGPIGGSSEMAQEKATYKIDCRFNKNDLANRIKEIGNRKNDIFVSNKDALKFLKDLRKSKYFIYLDPPYFEKGEYLYMSYYKVKDHRELSEYLKNTTKFSWVLSYDDNDEIKKMYSTFDLYHFPLRYTAQNVKTGWELLCHSSNLRMPNPLVIRRKGKNDIKIEKCSY